MDLERSKKCGPIDYLLGAIKRLEDSGMCMAYIS